ncbi:MAG: Eco57I restriction-modification methylase domain-containing protein [Dehalococcoidales bacterium]|nr:Eco57I restriction-modification methylase domain-containing protein [Dehalococcoidales bacterium]
MNYDRINQPLSRRDWNLSAANAITEDPVLFAGGGQNHDFHVVYSRLPQDRLLLGQERPVVNQLLKEHPYGMFIFSNQTQDRWHFINVKYDAETEKRRLFRRISIGPEERLRTASQRIAMLDLQSIQPDMFGAQPLTIQSRHDEAFDVEAVTRQFFEEYKAIFRILEDDLKKQSSNHVWAHDYSLQFLNRCMFIYFIQRKGWLGNDRDFLLSFWKSYQHSGQTMDTFVENWLTVLFFEAFCDKPIAYHTHFPAEIKGALSLAPYLNGGLFDKNKLDQEHQATISDQRFEQILKFLERYNFTIAEDSPLDKEVAVDPEMIGKVYESLVNVSEEVDKRGEAGIFYTPRTEIDLMCRLSLVDNLANHLGEDKKELLYQLVFALEPDEKTDADQTVTRSNLWPNLNERLRDITVLDPACGSGSFLVGMLNILDDLQERAGRQLDTTETSYERKKRIVGQSLYGVDVMEWACHVAELRLWLALIIDAEFTQEELHVRREPLLPHFSFKIRCGDSLVQEVGGINLGHIAASHEIPPSLKTRITDLKNEKLRFYDNDATGKLKSVEAIRNEEKRLFMEMLNARYQTIQEELKSRYRKLEGQQERRIRLDGTVEAAPPHQMNLEASKYRQEIENLTNELAQIEAARKALSSAREVPFVWDIAFVEIFEGEKEGFDIVIGNPPYVRQEAIADPRTPRDKVTADNKRVYKDKLARSVYQAFPHFFGYKSGSNTVAHKIDAKSDLYIYFYLRGLKLLNSKGSFCFITSNSWLDVGYGADLQEFLLKHGHVKLVLDNQVKRSFANADVNSIIVLLSAPDDRYELALKKMARFVMFRAPFEHILSPIIFDEIEEATERRATKEYRTFPIQQSKLLEDGCEIPEEEEAGKTVGPLIKTARYIGNKWGGKYLRAPDIYWTILEKAGKRLISLGDLGRVRYPIKTGINEFFYVDETIIEEFGIEKEFLLPVAKSPKDFESLRLKRENIKVYLFCCDLSLAELQQRGKKGALSYIQWGQRQVTKARQKTLAGIAWPEVPSVSGRKQWYTIDNIGTTDVACNRFFDRRFFFGFYDFPAIEDQTFYGLTLNSNYRARKHAQIALLNSTSSYLFIEVLGRVGLGLGVLQYARVDMERLLALDILSFEQSSIESLLRTFDLLSERPILSIFDETKQQDRRDLDVIVFKELGIAPAHVDYLYESLLFLIQERLLKADSLNNIRKAEGNGI